MPLTSALVIALLASSEPAAPEGGLTASRPAARFSFDRVDLISEDTGSWLHYELPMLRAYPTTPAVRFIEQVKVVFHLPWEGLYAGASIGSQSVVLERPILRERGLFWSAGLQTKLLFPRGVLAGVAWRFGRFRLGLSLSAFTGGSWARPQSTAIVVLPVLGFGIGRPLQAAEPPVASAAQSR